jgi:N-acetylglutamate synthase-like GNAT family acetyltransferase
MNKEAPLIRLAREEDLSYILALNRELNPGDPIVEVGEESSAVWQEILQARRADYYVLELAGKVVGAAMLIVSPNMTRGMRPLGVLQSVIISSVLRGQGYGRMLVRKILQRAAK